MTENLRSLATGEMLSDYRIDGVLGQGGFGITYLGFDVMLDRRVAIKEYYPREFAVRDSTLTVHAAGNQEDKDTFKWGLEQFIKEAKLLAKLNHPNIIGVRRFFEANGTAYFVMDYCEGRPLDDIIKVDGIMSPEQVNKIIYPVLDGLEHLHNVNFLHRDLKPANIYIKSDGSPVLLDFGAARQEIVSHSKSVTSLATPGYAAFEQYSTRGNQGAWTDIYGFAATLYRAITGEKPQDAPDRILQDTLTPVSKLCESKYPDAMLKAIDLGMAVRPEDRPQSIKEWRKIFESPRAESNPAPKSSSSEVKREVRKPLEPEAQVSSVTSAVSKTSNSSPTKLIVIVSILLVVVIAAWFMFSKGGKSVSNPEEVKQPVTVKLNQDKALDNIPQTPAPAPAPAQESRPPVSQQSTPRPKAPVQNNEPSLDLNKIVKDAVNR